MSAATGALVVAIVAAVCDLRSRRIPNWLTLPALVGALIWHFMQASWREPVLGLLLAVAIYLPLWLAGGRGAGDLKLMAALGAWMGPSAWIQVFVLTALLGGLWALVIVIAKGRLLVTLQNVFDILRSLLTGRRPAHRLESAGAIALPHGAIIALAMLVWVALMRPNP